MMLRGLVLAVVAAVAVTAARAAPQPPHPSYDHQTTPYTSHIKPMTLPDDTVVSMKPFFSPHHSIDTLTDLVAGVKYGGDITIGTPGFSSWSYCTWPRKGETCIGCSIPAQHAEKFPIFRAILNAVHHKKAHVRILTNNYNTATCKGYIAPLDFLALNGVEIRYYDSTTFWHAKYITVETEHGRNTSVSSVNFSFTSFMLNREAGIVFSGPGADQVYAFTDQVFEEDWNAGKPYVVSNHYDEHQLYQIHNSTWLNNPIPSPPVIPGSYVTPTPKFVTQAADVTIFTSPDYADQTLLSQVRSAKSTFQLHMYQVTDTGLCQELLNLHNSGVKVTMLVSHVIYDAHDSSLAAQCYARLHAAGMKIMLTPSYYRYSHQKYWIVDGKRMGMSTGNWSPSDYPAQAYFPPYPSAQWVPANRDFTVLTDGPGVVAEFENVLQQDLSRGSVYNGTFGGQHAQ